MRLLRVTPADLAIGVAVTVAMVVPAFVPYRQPWWVVVLALLGSAPVTWRRTLLLPVGVVAGGAVTALALAHESLAHQLPWLMPYGPLVWTYTFADLARPAWRVARTGDPSGRRTVPRPVWPAYRTPRRTTMMWGLRPGTADDPRGGERRLWDGYPFDALDL